MRFVTPRTPSSWIALARAGEGLSPAIPPSMGRANRAERIFCDRAGLAGARSTAPFLVQSYERDTGERLSEVSAPIAVRGRRWSALRIGFRPQAP